MKLVEVKTAKEFASTFFGDPVLKMAVNAALDNAPGFDLVRCKDCGAYNKNGCADGFGWCGFVDKGMMDNDFCSHGGIGTNGERENK